MKENRVTKVCSFCIDDMHLAMMVLPQINKLLDKQEKVQTIFEKGIKENVEKILSKMNLKLETENKILEMNYNSNTCKFSKIKKQIEEIANKGQVVNIIISGRNEYIQIANEIIEKVAKELKQTKITIINCYKASENEEIEDILDKHDYVLNTSGIKQIEEVYIKYKRKTQKIAH